MGELLTVDLGNSSCKLRLWATGPEPEVIDGAEFPTGVELGSAAADWASTRAAGCGVALCAVASEEVEAALRASLESAVAGPIRRPEPGLRLDCEHVETIGDDRLFAARGALALLGRSAVVVDVGTAMTVDLLRVEGGARLVVGVFAGGAIAPGPALLAQALASGGARLPAIDPRPGAPALGKHTRAALEAGVAVGLRGAARELVKGISASAGEGELPVVVSGGAADYLLAGEPLAAEVHVDPELVHRGLLHAALPAPSDERSR